MHSCQNEDFSYKMSRMFLKAELIYAQEVQNRKSLFRKMGSITNGIYFPPILLVNLSLDWEKDLLIWPRGIMFMEHPWLTFRAQMKNNANVYILKGWLLGMRRLEINGGISSPIVEYNRFEMSVRNFGSWPCLPFVCSFRSPWVMID